jgi:uncharacterized protein (DUF433 family)
MTAAIHDRGRGPEIVGTRITVYTVFDYLENGWEKEETLKYLPITSEQYDVAVQYIHDHHDEVMAVHQRIEERNARGNPPEIRAKLEESHRRFLRFKEWLAARKEAGAVSPVTANGASDRSLRREYDEWLATQEATDGGRP